jgi:hypothetical protein
MSKFSSREKDQDGNEYVRFYSSSDEYYRAKGCSPTPSARSGSNGSGLGILGWIPSLLLIWFIGNWVMGSVKNNSIPPELRIANFIKHHENTLGVLEKQLADCTSHCGIYKNTVKSQRLKLSNFKKLSLDQQAQDADQNCINGTFYRTCVDSTQNKKYF